MCPAMCVLSPFIAQGRHVHGDRAPISGPGNLILNRRWSDESWQTKISSTTVRCMSSLGPRVDSQARYALASSSRSMGVGFDVGCDVA
jgi:hypothetical protein